MINFFKAGERTQPATHTDLAGPIWVKMFFQNKTGDGRLGLPGTVGLLKKKEKKSLIQPQNYQSPRLSSFSSTFFPPFSLLLIFFLLSLCPAPTHTSQKPPPTATMPPLHLRTILIMISPSPLFSFSSFILFHFCFSPSSVRPPYFPNICNTIVATTRAAPPLHTFPLLPPLFFSSSSLSSPSRLYRKLRPPAHIFLLLSCLPCSAYFSPPPSLYFSFSVNGIPFFTITPTALPTLTSMQFRHQHCMPLLLTLSPFLLPANSFPLVL